MPFFSIIIPTYNRSSIICRNILSLTKQSFQNFEIIVIDDGSTDDTEERVKILQKSIANLSYYYQSNAERSAARNNGIKKAKGEFIICLDSDDYFDNNHLQVLYNYIQNLNELECAIISGYKYDKKGLISEAPFPDLPIKNKQIYFFQNPVIPARVCIHKNIFENFIYDTKITIVEDAILWAQISTLFPMHEIKNSTVYYSLHDDNSVNIKNYSAKKRLNGLRRYFSNPVSDELNNRVKKELISDCYYRIAKSHNYHGKTKLFRSCLVKSIITSPLSKTFKYKIFEYLDSYPLFNLLWRSMKRIS